MTSVGPKDQGAVGRRKPLVTNAHQTPAANFKNLLRVTFKRAKWKRQNGACKEINTSSLSALCSYLQIGFWSQHEYRGNLDGGWGTKSCRQHSIFKGFWPRWPLIDRWLEQPITALRPSLAVTPFCGARESEVIQVSMRERWRPSES